MRAIKTQCAGGSKGSCAIDFHRKEIALPFAPKLDILPPEQRELWPALAAVPGSFVLYGGTGLALRLGHRVSEDFDFFSSAPFQPEDLERTLPFLAGSVRLQIAANTLTSRAGIGSGVKVSFFGGLRLRRIADPDLAADTGVRVASLLDLAGCKAQVVQARAESKDYLDLARLLDEGIGLDTALGAARAIYGESFNPLLSLKALSYFSDGDLAALAATVRDRLLCAVRRVDPGALPRFEPLPGGLAP